MHHSASLVNAFCLRSWSRLLEPGWGLVDDNTQPDLGLHHLGQV
jgi:hypothetical protein